MINRTLQPPIHTIDNIRFLTPEHTTVNGMNMYFLSGLDIDVLKIEIVLKAGSVWQQKSLQAAFTAKMLKKGTVSFNAEKLAYIIDFNGAYIETGTDKDLASITLYCTHDNFKEMLNVLIEVYALSVFPPEELSKILVIEKNQFLVNQEKVEYIASKKFQQLLFPNHPYGKLAEITDYDDISIKDLKSFYETFYLNQHANIYVSGMITDEIKTTILNKFSVIELPSYDFPTIAQVADSHKENCHIPKKDAVQAAIRIGKTMPARQHPDYVKLQLLTMILGGYFGSRLMKNIREDKGFTYGIYAVYQTFMFGNYLAIGTEVKNEVKDQALNEIYKEIDLLRTISIPEEELQKVKTYVLGKFLKSCDGAFEQMELFKMINENGLPKNYFQQYIEKINNTTSDDLLTCAGKYLNQNNMVEVVVSNH